ncbi:MAG: type II toxin-antitoxin system RelE/ParE family toxin [Candidatus Aminicenantes bacterium]|nr:type II toxin-antitoxin system RelE/ParE family toxin [Candidatus Aminicenantes bacterium]
MPWKIDYSKSAKKFIDEHKITKNIRELLKKLILKIGGEEVNINIKKLKGKWDSFLRIRKGNIRIILKVHKKEKRIFIERVDFRGNVY